MADQRGLKWIQDAGLKPIWTEEPQLSIIESIVRKSLKLSEGSPCKALLHSTGTYNKTYTITTATKNYTLRVALPADPFYKTMSEIVTVEYVREHTDTPVPKILAFDALNENALGFEWILLEHMAGEPLRTRWRGLSMDAKKGIVKTLALYQAQLFDGRFEGVGNIYFSNTDESDAEASGKSYTVGRMVSPELFLGGHLSDKVSRGPFDNGLDWLKIRVLILLMVQGRVLRISKNAGEIRKAKDVKETTVELLRMITNCFGWYMAETTTLFHGNMSLDNVLVDDEGAVTAVLDWECVSTVPLWRACQFPLFIDGPDRKVKPNQESPEYTEVVSVTHEKGSSSLYWKHMHDYECTILRPVFLEEMVRLQPQWVQEKIKQPIKAELEFALSQVGGPALKIVKRWALDYRAGKRWSLRERVAKS